MCGIYARRGARYFDKLRVSPRLEPAWHPHSNSEITWRECLCFVCASCVCVALRYWRKFIGQVHTVRDSTPLKNIFCSLSAVNLWCARLRKFVYVFHAICIEFRGDAKSKPIHVVNGTPKTCVLSDHRAPSSHPIYVKCGARHHISAMIWGGKWGGERPLVANSTSRAAYMLI